MKYLLPPPKNLLANILRCLKRAYGPTFGNRGTHDCWFWRAKHAIPKEKACEFYLKAGVIGYNNFNPRLLLLLPKGSQIIVAREYSVCVYVNGDVPKKYKKKLKADEFWYNPNSDETRIWWD